MNIIEVTTKKQLDELKDCSAMTWEGLIVDDFEKAMADCSKAGRNGIGYLTKGATMNKLCRLTDYNAYPDDLNIFSIKDYTCLAYQVGARWMDDIIENNARRQREINRRKKAGRPLID